MKSSNLARKCDFLSFQYSSQWTLPTILEFIEYFEQISLLPLSRWHIKPFGLEASNGNQSNWLCENGSLMYHIQKLGSFIYTKHTNAAQKYNLWGQSIIAVFLNTVSSHLWNISLHFPGS